MDEEAARRLLEEADAVAGERLKLMLHEQAKLTEGFVNGLVPWLHGNAWAWDWRAEVKEQVYLRFSDYRGPLGRFKPAAKSAIDPALAWMYAARRGWSHGDSWSQLFVILQPFDYELPSPRYDGAVIHGAFERGAVKRAAAERGVRELHFSLQEFAISLRTLAGSPGCLLKIPELVQPPRYARLGDGVSARTFSEDLEQRIRSSLRLEAHLTSGSEPLPLVEEWVGETELFLYRCLGDGASIDFHHFTSGIKALKPPNALGLRARYPLLADVNGIARAYVALGRVYLEKVRTFVSDYAEASGQGERRDPVTVYGNVGAINSEVNNSHLAVADTVISIGASIQAIADLGQADIAAALRALTEAIRQAPELAETQRADLLNNVADVAEAAAAPNEPRKVSRAKAAIAAITSAAGASTQLAQALTMWHQVAGLLF